MGARMSYQRTCHGTYMGQCSERMGCPSLGCGILTQSVLSTERIPEAENKVIDTREALFIITLKDLLPQL